MDEDRELIIEKALKIRELCNRGVDGEKSAAIGKLKDYMEKYSITEDELNSINPLYNEWYQNLNRDERTSNFAKWFRNSTCVYKGKPVVFFHKSRSLEPFDEFKHDVGVKMWGEGTNYGFHFSLEKDAGSIRHIGNNHLGNGVEFKVYLKMVNPYYIYARRDGNCYGQRGEPHVPIWIDKNLIDNLTNDGFDSILIQDESRLNVFIVFNPNQIKSVEGNEYYNPESNNIYE